jgi:hypothetical protein
VQDLSSLAKGSLTMGCSMGAGNTISDPPKFGAPGMPSEATSDLPYDPQFNDPEPRIGTPSSAHTDTKMNSSGKFSTSSLTWKDCP